jgi:hypothetical protein
MDGAEDPFNFSVYMDKVGCFRKFSSDILLITVTHKAPLTISVNSPLELVQQFFVKLGARYVVVTDENGHCEFIFSSFSSTDDGGTKPHLEQTLQMKASLTKMVGSLFSVSWRRRQSETSTSALTLPELDQIIYSQIFESIVSLVSIPTS